MSGREWLSSMEPHRIRKQLALDTNVLLDLADGADFAHDFRETSLSPLEPKFITKEEKA
jgi:hypothetical protein